MIELVASDEDTGAISRVWLSWSAIGDGDAPEGKACRIFAWIMLG